MEVGIQTQHPVVRIILALVGVFLTPAGVWVLWGAFQEPPGPHVFVMLVFSGSLTLLLGLVGLIGFVASFGPKAAPAADKNSD